MHFKQGNMLAARGADVVLFTGNAYVTHDGRLTMGRGAALDVRLTYPGIDYELGSVLVRFRRGRSPLPFYGVLLAPDITNPQIGIFQVKHHWVEPAKEALIVASVDVLRRLARESWKTKIIFLNFPGIGNGRLSRETVLPLLHRLPNNVYVWEL